MSDAYETCEGCRRPAPYLESDGLLFLCPVCRRRDAARELLEAETVAEQQLAEREADALAVEAELAGTGSSPWHRDGMTIEELETALAGARRVAARAGLHNAGVLRFRFAIPYGELACSGFGDVDPFGPVVAVTLTSDGTTLIDIVPERIEAKQTGLFT